MRGLVRLFTAWAVVATVLVGVFVAAAPPAHSLGSSQYDKVFHRTGDNGAWCGTISTNVTQGTANPATCP